MTGPVVLDAVLVILADAIPGAPEIGPETDLLESGLLDSLALLEVVERVEHLAGVVLPAHLISPETFRTPQDVCRAIATLGALSPAPRGDHA